MDTCNQVREMIEFGGEKGTLDSSSKAKVDEHLLDCLSCQKWAQQTESMVSMASAMPQFDVSEALTQNIMSSIQSEVATRKSPTMSMVSVVSTFAALAILFYSFSFDNVYGLISWTIGLASMYLLQRLVCGGTAESTPKLTG